jgi:glycine oxidase
LESRLNRPLYHQKPILRLFNCAQERAYWEKRRAQAGYQRYLGALADANDTAQSLDGFYIRQSGYLDTKALLGALKDFLRQQQRLLETPLNYADIHISDTGVSWKNIIADRLVFCEGQQIRNNPWFSWLPLQPAQGEILTLRTRHPLPEYIINCGKWLLPLAPDQLKIGATFQWQPLDGKPSAEGKQQLLNACRQLGWESQTDEVLEQACGVRPGTRDKKPFLGFHPSLPRLGVFNGFGAKGSLWIPYFAALFADYLCGSTKLPNEVDIKRFGFQESSRIC